MSGRLDLSQAAPQAYKAVRGLEDYIQANIGHTLLHLVKLRASILNGCSFCVDMHTRDALADGADSRRLFAVAAWLDAPFFTDQVRGYRNRWPRPPRRSTRWSRWISATQWRPRHCS